MNLERLRGKTTGEMKVTNIHRLAWLLVIALVSNVARAQDLKKERQSLLACYATEAVLRGSQSCDPPATLLHAVFEKCLSRERALRVALLRLRPGDVVLAENAIKHVRERMSRRIQRAIRDVQTGGGQCS
jgi:hypothetical protein